MCLLLINIREIVIVWIHHHSQERSIICVIVASVHELCVSVRDCFVLVVTLR